MARPKLKLRQVRPGGASAWGDGSSYLDAVGERLRSYGPGYFGTRNLGVGASCHERILSASAEGDLPDPAEARRLAAACDVYSSQLVSVLHTFAAA